MCRDFRVDPVDSTSYNIAINRHMTFKYGAFYNNLFCSVVFNDFTSVKIRLRK